ncbi:MAG: NUDIX hydrolase [Candidatus Erginobacter occultus]|nr:NUDIX hydrolase [Candidatus Erginobacter occultus]
MKQSPTLKKGEVLLRGPFFALRRCRVGYPNGEEKERIILEHPGAAAAIPLLPGNRVLMVRQYRAAAGRLTLEIPAGKLEPGETPEESIRRELVEETGYRAGRLKHLRSYYPSLGISDEIIHIFQANDLAPAGEPSGDETGLETVILTLDEVRKKIEAGEILDSKTIIAVRELDAAQSEQVKSKEEPGE